MTTVPVSDLPFPSGAMSRQVGAIDMGSRNFKFVYGWQDDEGTITTRLVGKQRLEIGREVTENNGLIGHQKFAQIRKAVSPFMRYCNERGAPTVLGIGTSAIRNARNQAQIIDLAREMGVDMDIADGVREGEVGYLAASGGAGNRLVSDSGSNSIQIVWERDGRIHSHSVPVGYELAYESFVERAASLEETRRAYHRFLDGNFGELPEGTEQFIALAANAIARFVLGETRPGRRVGSLSRVALDARLAEIGALSPTGYEALKSSLPNATKILPGLVFLDYIMGRSGHQEALITENELPVGLIVEYLSRQGAGPDTSLPV